jgi:hypothetical protein
MRELSGRDDFCGLCFTEPCQQFGIFDFEQHLAGRDVLSPGDRALSNAAINASRNIDAGRVSFALNGQRLGLD